MDVIRFHFNTRRLYSVYGQIVEVKYDPASGEVLFCDLSRMIDGKAMIDPELRDKKEIQRQVMHAYDYIAYTHGRESWEFYQEVLRKWTKAMFEAERVVEQ